MWSCSNVTAGERTNERDWTQSTSQFTPTNLIQQGQQPFPGPETSCHTQLTSIHLNSSKKRQMPTLKSGQLALNSEPCPGLVQENSSWTAPKPCQEIPHKFNRVGKSASHCAQELVLFHLILQSLCVLAGRMGRGLQNNMHPSIPSPLFHMLRSPAEIHPSPLRSEEVSDASIQASCLCQYIRLM